MSKYTDKFIDILMAYGPKFLLTIITLIVGLWVIKLVSRGFNKTLSAKKVDDSLRTFLVSLGAMLLKVLLVISVASMIGIQMTSFIAVIGAAGLAVGMALSGTLQNFAGGAMILMFKPYKVGDYIEAQGHAGTVREIQIFHTVLKTPDNKTIIIPNAPLSTGSMTNYSTEPTRRVDFTFGIGYGDDIDKAKEVIRSIVKADARVHNEPAPLIVVAELGDSSVNLVLRIWVDAVNFWSVRFDTIEAVKKEFDKQDITIPFPQRDVHLFQENVA